MFLQEKCDVLRVVLRFANVMMHIWCTRNLLILGLAALVVSLMNTPDTSLTSLNLCYLLHEGLAAGTSVSSFWRAMFQFTLNTTVRMALQENANRCYVQVLLSKSLWCRIALW